MDIITQETLKNGVDKQGINGVILVNNYTIEKTKTGADYIKGTLQSGGNISFKAWNNSSAFKALRDNDYTNVPSYISGAFDAFGGSLSITLDSIQAVDGFTPDMFYKVKYDINGYVNALKTVVQQNISEKGFKYVEKILFNNEEVMERFKVEFAATSHHDNCKSGLLAHTYKVCSNLNYMLRLYPSLYKRNNEVDNDFKDVCMIGAVLHDVGKIYEMEFGVYQPISRVTHRYLGTELIAPYKDEIICDYSELWYYDLISIMLQHHGEYGDDCKTLCSYLVHEADNLDAKLTLIEQNLEMPSETSSGLNIKIDGKKLSL